MVPARKTRNAPKASARIPRARSNHQFTTRSRIIYKCLKLPAGESTQLAQLVSPNCEHWTIGPGNNAIGNTLTVLVLELYRTAACAHYNQFAFPILSCF